MNDPDRDKFYSSTSDDADDGDDYELEPPDADVLAGEERRAREAIEDTRAAIDIDEIYRDADRQRSTEILESWARDFRFRFQVKHLLIATAVLAIVLTLYKLEMLGTAVVLLVMISVAGLYFYLQWQEKKAQDEANRRRQELYARRRAQFKRMKGEATDDDESDSAGEAEIPKAPEPLPSEVDQAWQQAMAEEKFRFRFSLAELMIAMTTAAVIFGLVQILGGEVAATMLGFIALFGLVIHALGVEPPSVVVLGWWMILALYVLLSIGVAVWSSFAG
jgi:hypothetical protein